MRVAVTGTPGTGKTTATERLDTDLDVIHLNDVIEAEGLYTDVDEARDSKVADLEAVRDYLNGRDDVLVESHLSHLLDVDRVVVLRCAPGELERRLIERGEPSEKAEENAESEALDVILSEAVRVHGEANVYEIDATDADPDAVADEIEAVVAGDRDPSAGEVDFTEYL
ncbi:MAG: adenylate kinase family protein [Halobacterium sp.]